MHTKNIHVCIGMNIYGTRGASCWRAVAADQDVEDCSFEHWGSSISCATTRVESKGDPDTEIPEEYLTGMTILLPTSFVGKGGL